MSRRARSVTLRVPKMATEPSTIVATTPEIARAGAPGATAIWRRYLELTKP